MPALYDVLSATNVKPGFLAPDTDTVLDMTPRTALRFMADCNQERVINDSSMPAVKHRCYPELNVVRLRTAG